MVTNAYVIKRICSHANQHCISSAYVTVQDIDPPAATESPMALRDRVVSVYGILVPQQQLKLKYYALYDFFIAF